MNMIWEKNGYTKEVERRDGENWTQPTGPTTRPDTGLSIERTDLQSRSA